MHFAILVFTLLMCVGCHVSQSPLPAGEHEQDCESAATCSSIAPGDSGIVVVDGSMSWISSSVPQWLPTPEGGDLSIGSTWRCHEIASDSGRGLLDCTLPGQSDAGWDIDRGACFMGQRPSSWATHSRRSMQSVHFVSDSCGCCSRSSGVARRSAAKRRALVVEGACGGTSSRSRSTATRTTRRRTMRCRRVRATSTPR